MPPSASFTVTLAATPAPEVASVIVPFNVKVAGGATANARAPCVPEYVAVTTTEPLLLAATIPLPLTVATEVVDDSHEASDVTCLLYTSDAADDLLCVDLGGRR